MTRRKMHDVARTAMGPADRRRAALVARSDWGSPLERACNHRFHHRRATRHARSLVHDDDSWVSDPCKRYRRLNETRRDPALSRYRRSHSIWLSLWMSWQRVLAGRSSTRRNEVTQQDGRPGYRAPEARETSAHKPPATPQSIRASPTACGDYNRRGRPPRAVCFSAASCVCEQASCVFEHRESMGMACEPPLVGAGRRGAVSRNFVHLRDPERKSAGSLAAKTRRRCEPHGAHLLPG